jgi:indolepyruvate ferredoxin oxidoreductase
MNAPVTPREITLEDKYTLNRGRAYMTAIQALVRLMMLQQERDARAGLNTAGYVSGYRGSPLGGLDLALARATPHLERHRIRFQPGVNEDLAATAIWGTQQLGLFPGAKHDGVFAMWYGKAPGVDRSGDAFRHGNAAGSARHGGVLLAAGDDPAARSTTVADQTDFMFKALLIPLLAPASVQDILDLGLHGFAMSRYSGCWVGFKCVSDVAEASASVIVDPEHVQIHTPADFEMPEGGLNIRYPDFMLDAEARLKNHKLFAALAYARANGLNRITLDSPRARLGLVAAGKAYTDLRQALATLGIDADRARTIGLRVLKVDMPWPLEPDAVRSFATGLEEILVVEEKRPLIEEQIKEQLYHWPEAARPRVVGKLDGIGQWEHAAGADWLIPPTSELTSVIAARAIASRILRFMPSEPLAAKLATLTVARDVKPSVSVQRTPWFCSGCPHNTSTRVPEGSRATAGIGCHWMAVLMDRSTATWTHMGGEGAPWIGQAHFCDTRHIFANLGDGTYFHSGYLAIRAAVAAKVPITYKILYNDAVAMTGGQPHDGQLTVPQITRQMAAEGVERIVVVTDEHRKYPGNSGFAPGVAVHHRDDLDRVQRELRDWSIANGAVSVLVYDQTCAAEKRRRRKRGAFPDPARRAYINTAVCEGCGDCSTQSNCLSIEPVETDLGTKRRINQSSCNKDYSCLKGFCPSFVTVEGGRPRRGRGVGHASADWPALPEPQQRDLAAPYNILVTGIGGTGVVTIGALLGMAAHLEGKGVTVLDVTGLAQKGGAVMSHVRIAAEPDAILGTRIGDGEADAVIACDAVVADGAEARAKMRPGHTRMAVNSAVTPTADFTARRDFAMPEAELERDLAGLAGAERVAFVAATRLATALLGDAIATNPFLLGYAYQRGLVPVSAQAIERAIELNGATVDANKQAFLWGRRAAHDPARVERELGSAEVVPLERARPRTLDELIERRVALLTEYQNAAYAERYRRLVERVRTAEQPLGSTKLAEAVARYYAKLLAYKDEYEVARLYSRPEFGQGVTAAFEGTYALRFHFAPPLLARRDPSTGRPRKIAFGSWMLPALRWLAKFRFLRGTAFDPFGRSAERRAERQLIADYEATIEELLRDLSAGRLSAAVEIASLPDEIRGFGPVKAESISKTKAREAVLRASYRSPAARAA